MNNTNAKPVQKSAIEATVTLDDSAGMGGNVPLGRLTLEFSNGRSLAVDASQLAPGIIGHAIMHGLKQKLVDAAAISRDSSTGKAATIETKYEAVKDVFDRLMSGEWNKRREGGGATGGLLKRALIELYAGRKTAEQITEYLDGKSDKDKAALRKNPKVATIIERLRAEDAKDSGTDAGVDLLAELDEMGGDDDDTGDDEGDDTDA